MKQSHPPRSAPNTMDAWILIFVSFGLYAICSIAFSKISIIGGAAAGQLLCLLLPAILYVKLKSGSAVDGLRLRPVGGAILWRTVLLALTFIGVSNLIQLGTQPLFEKHFPNSNEWLDQLSRLLIPDSASGLLFNLAVVGLIVPICEEAIFRGAFQGRLESRGPTRAIIASSVVFAFVHLNPLHFVPILFIGFAMGFVTWRTQSLWPAILWHILNNSAAILMLYFGGKSASIPIWLNVALAVGFFVLAWEFLRHMKTTPPAESGPLANAQSTCGSWGKRVAPAGGLLVLLPVLFLFICFGRAKLASDFLAPDYTSGDMVFYTRGLAFGPDNLKTGDIVVYHGPKGLYFTRILDMDGDHITIIGAEDPSGQRGNEDILRNRIAGKVVWKFDPGPEVKAIMGVKTTSNGATNDLQNLSDPIQKDTSQSVPINED